MPGSVAVMSSNAPPPPLDNPPKSFAEVAVDPPPPPRHKPPKSFAQVAVEPPPSSPQTNGTRLLDISTAKSPGQYEGTGILDAPTSPTRTLHTVPRQRRSKASLQAKSPSNLSLNSEDTLYEAYHHDGRLTSIRPPIDYEQNLNLDEKESKRNANVEKTKGHQELSIESGRVAAAGWERSGIRWAPLNIPLKRRMQTAVVLMHTLCIAFTLGWFFWLCAIPIFWPIMIPYLIILLTSKAHCDGSLSNRSAWFRRQKIWSLFASYYPARLHRTTELPPTRKYVFGYHPHGIISHGAFAAFATEALGWSQLFPGITNSLLTLDTNFRVPFYRDYLLRLGICSVSRESCENLLSHGGPNNEGMGRGVTIVVGGARESLETEPGTLRLVLDGRKGFVKLAIRQGADLVPVLSFGENDIYEQISPKEHPWIHKGQMLIKKAMGFTVPLFHARGIFNYDVGLMPYRRPMNIVVGRPVRVMKTDKPSQEYVEEIHAAYVRELTWIWDSFKDEFAKDRSGELDIIA